MELDYGVKRGKLPEILRAHLASDIETLTRGMKV